MGIFLTAFRLLALLAPVLLPASASGIGEASGSGALDTADAPWAPADPDSGAIWDGDSKLPESHATEVSRFESEKEERPEEPASLDSIRTVGDGRPSFRLVRDAVSPVRLARSRACRDLARGPPAPRA